MFILSNIIQFYTISTKNFLGKDPHTPPRGKTRDVIFIKSIVCKAVSIAKIDFDHTKAIDTEAPIPFSYVCVWFFFLVNNFGRLDPPPLTKIPGSAPCSGFVFSN